MTTLFVGAVFLAATLLFLVQPMTAKAILPMLGGSPAVWNTSMVFFQAALLAGYAYSHGLARRLSLRRQVVLHTGVLLAASITLPAVVPTGWAPPPEAAPAPWVLAVLAVMLGSAFIVVATSGPLLQGWFSRTTHKAAGDPYFLYAASNVGSFAGLLAYPLIVERAFDLRTQAWVWTGGYALLGCLILACGLTALRRAAPDLSTQIRWQQTVPAPRPSQRLRWVAFAFIPAALMLAVTQHLSTDVASMPLLWVIPLSIYLLTFVIAFSSRSARLLTAWSWGTPVMAVTLGMVILEARTSPILVQMLVHLSAQFILSMLCHQRLAAERPHPSRLTEFYLLLAVGGVLGGIFCALLAPVIFHSILEYPIVVVLACLVRPRRPARRGWKPTLIGLALIVIPTFLFFACKLLVASIDALGGVSAALVVVVPAAACFLSIHRPMAFALALLLLMAAQWNDWQSSRDLLARQRTFFGVLEATRQEIGGFTVHELTHGTTSHGAQVYDESTRHIATAYYGELGPVGDLFVRMHHSPRRIGIVGLGAGTIAAYARAADRFTFFEIDPGVVAIAENPDIFTFLSDARRRGAYIDTILGDGRRTLRLQPDKTFELLIVDAFSSDAIPMHLLTREAIAEMVDKLAEGGVLAIHISNRHLDLAPVVSAIADNLGLVFLQRWDPGAPDYKTNPLGRYASDWIALARSPEDLADLLDSGLWSPARAIDPKALWTDRRSNILRVMRTPIR
ncbi:MAG: fused MFS/spermidine synthase [Phycisphaeraceae bacterium]|nr:fused MFS/spermidine synthase [Phycisphaeraceae bacterium]